ncbi:Nose resistant to fluoxetine protein 6 [Hondaea fermentalgiana]|uniref:Nose resistant to fluoxetine protein 6 n=1 Tax=Hondaea fermentalgiana TaxID=2315210 RepID=A0A2R5GKV3_9STRA|nr:Nose resistant to fluoxetine protein 6 [Hondaea fermentalgiana]|eukprot:GBG31265.1 Nose resistant to fluoxetine protein 6 [Hondaea fermentalgiana]
MATPPKDTMGSVSRLAAAVSLLAALTGSDTVAASETQEIAACLPMACWDTWEAYGANVTLPCSVASGHLPLDGIPLALPMLYEGNYDLCQTFQKAHYCNLASSSIVLLPVLNKKLKLAGALPLGTFSLDQCVSQACDPVALKVGFFAGLERAIDRLLRGLHVSAQERAAIEKEVQVLAKSISVTCVDESVLAPMDSGGILTLVVLGGFCVSFVMCTLLATYARNSKPARCAMTRFFALNHNAPRLVASTPGDFNVLNGIRFWSMAWVILGHTIGSYVYPGKNPSAIAAVLQSFPFVFVRGAEYAVDTFFFMSGFLATWGVLVRFTSERITPKSYGMLILGRYLRLTPVYALVVLFFWKVLPHLGSGPYWSVVPRTVEACEGSFIFNMLYVNNIFPLGSAGALTSCAGWTWYLANDFQFFLLVPFLVLLFKIGYFRLAPGWKAELFKYGPCVFLVLFQVIITYTLIITEHSGDPLASMGNIYVKPYCRVTPYAIGAGLAFFHFERVEAAKSNSSEDPTAWKRWNMPSFRASLLMPASIAAMTAVIAIVYTQYACKASDHQCNVYYAQFRYGFFISPNWSTEAMALYGALGYFFWTLPLAIFSYTLICDDRYDSFGLKVFLGHRIWAPFARLTYNAYLVHLVLMFARGGLSKYAKAWEGMNVMIEIAGFVVMAYATALVLYLVVEKPVMNIVMQLFSSVRQAPPSHQSMSHVDDVAMRMERQLSSVSDLDSETVQMASPELESRHSPTDGASVPFLSSSEHVPSDAVGPA